MLKRRSARVSLAHSRSGIAAIEFSFVAPMLFLMVSGSFDVAKALILKHQVEDTSHLVAISATTVSVIANSKITTITDTAAQQAMSLVYAEMPWVRSGVEQGKRSVTLTSVAFIPVPSCTPTPLNNCFSAKVAFSVGYTGGAQSSATPFTQVVRPCGALTQITHNAIIPNGQTQLGILRTAEVAKPDALLIADVHYQYTPTFLKFVTGKLDFWSTTMVAARSGDTTLQGASQGVQYTTFTGSGGTGNCPNIQSP